MRIIKDVPTLAVVARGSKRRRQKTGSFRNGYGQDDGAATTFPHLTARFTRWSAARGA